MSTDAVRKAVAVITLILLCVGSGAEQTTGPGLSEAQQLLLEASLLKIEGQTEEAISRYSQIVQKHAEHKTVARLARRNLLSLWLARDQVDLTTVKSHLDALKDEDGRFSADAWNLACRVLFREVGAARPEERKAVWSRGLAGLAGDGVSLSAEALADLDRLARSLDANGSLSAMEVLTDLLLLVPDTPAMHELQKRRVEALRAGKAWDDAKAAAMLDVILASATSAGPAESVKQLGSILSAAGTSASDVEACESAMRWGDLAEKRGPVVKKRLPADRMLKASATALLARQRDRVGGRRRAFLNVFAGNVTEALQAVHATLATTPADAERIGEALDDVSLILALSDGDFWNSRRYVQWLAGGPAHRDRLLGSLIQLETPPVETVGPKGRRGHFLAPKMYEELLHAARREVARRQLQRWKHALIGWGSNALKTGDKAWTEACWARAIALESDASGVVSLIDGGFDLVCAWGVSSELFEELVTGMVPRIQTPAARRRLLVKAATLHFNGGRFARCLGVLDKADKAAPALADAHDMTVGLMRALSLLRLRKSDDALSQLKQMAAWAGTDAQHARATFLVAWLYLQRNAVFEASMAFRKVMDRYPQTTFAKKAREMVCRLEGL